MNLPFSLDDICKVTFYKRDEITTDLICCDVEVAGADGPKTWFNHEESDSWGTWTNQLSMLPGFDSDWLAKVCTPAFEPSVTVAYERQPLNPLP